MRKKLIAIFKAALFSLAILSAAISFLSWLVRWPFPRLIDSRDRERLTRWAGVAEPEMQPHWDRYYQRWWDPHLLNNLGSECARLDPQRAFKFLAFYVVIYAGIGRALIYAAF